MAEVSVQAADFDPAAETDRMAAGHGDLGALVTFAGLCRDEAGRLAALEIEHYPGMAEAELGRIAAEAEARWPLLGLRVIHRHGRIGAGERIVFVAAASAHRGDALAATAFLMDYLKTRAPFWKREHRADGTTGPWVAARDTDEAAAARWTAAP